MDINTISPTFHGFHKESIYNLFIYLLTIYDLDHLID